MPNLALLAIPAYTVLTLAPHAYAFSIAAKGLKLNNANPHGSSYTDALKKALSTSQFERYERAEGAHRNTIENAPLFIGTVLASVLAEQKIGTDVGAAKFAGTFLSLRVLYSLLYINTEDQKFASVRSIVFMGSLGLAIWQLWTCAVALG